MNKITSQVFMSREKIISVKSILSTHICNYYIIYLMVLCIIYFYTLFYKMYRFRLNFKNFINCCFYLKLFLRNNLFIFRKMTNLVEYKYYSIDIIINKKIKVLTAFVYFVSISIVGMKYSLTFFLTKSNKTIYRCTFYGICHIFIDATFFFSICIEENIEKTYLYFCSYFFDYIFIYNF